MIRILLPRLVCIVGAVVHLLSKRAAALGAWAFGVGLLLTLYQALHLVVRIG